VGSQPLDGNRDLTPSNSIRRPSWYEMTLMDSQEQEAPRSTLMDSQEQDAPRSTLMEKRPLTEFSNFMALICSVINSVTSNI
jgi:hypothetical protein